MDKRIQEMIDRGYSPAAIAMYIGGPVGTMEYHNVLRQLDPNWGKGCPHCGAKPI